MLRRIAYLDEEYGEILVPADPGTFETDFASVPTLLTWLVPRTGAHLPAALDPRRVGGRQGLRRSPDDRSTGSAADLVFRRAMRDSGIPLIRRWLVWSAVSLGTIWAGSESWSGAQHLRYRVTAFGSLLLVAALGIAATLDLFDVVAWLPWMGADRGFVLELVGGLAGAIVVPLLLGLTWGRFAIAGAVTGIALAVLLHVTALLLAVTALYQLAERVARRTPIAGLVATARRAGRQPAADGAAGRHVRLGAVDIRCAWRRTSSASARRIASWMPSAVSTSAVPTLARTLSTVVSRSCKAAGVQVGGEDGELVAAEAADDVVGTQDRADGLGDGVDQLVAGDVPLEVVDLLQPVDVDERDRSARRRPELGEVPGTWSRNPRRLSRPVSSSVWESRYASCASATSCSSSQWIDTFSRASEVASARP